MLLYLQRLTYINTQCKDIAFAFYPSGFVPSTIEVGMLDSGKDAFFMSNN